MKTQTHDPKTNLNYHLANDGMYYPTFTPPENNFVGKYGLLHLDYIKEHKKSHYTNLLTSGELNAYLCEVDKRAKEMVSTIINQMAKSEGCDETLKAQDQMKWTGLMGNYKASAEEVILREMVYN